MFEQERLVAVQDADGLQVAMQQQVQPVPVQQLKLVVHAHVLSSTLEADEHNAEMPAAAVAAAAGGNLDASAKRLQCCQKTADKLEIVPASKSQHWINKAPHKHRCQIFMRKWNTQSATCWSQALQGQH